MNQSQTIYQEYLENSKSPMWMAAFNIAMGEMLAEQCMVHQNKIQAIADFHTLRRAEAARGALAKSYVLGKLAEIRKDAEFNEDDHPRNPRGVGGGRFAPKNAGTFAEALPRSGKKSTSPSNEAAGKSPRQFIAREMYRDPSSFTGGRTQHALGALAGAVQLDPNASDTDHRKEVNTRISEMVNALYVRTNEASDKQKVQLMITNPDTGKTRMVITDTMPDDLKFHERVQFMSPVGPDNPVKAGGAIFNVAQMAGANSENAAKAGSIGNDIRDTMETTSWGKKLTATTNAINTATNGHPIAAQAHAVATMFEVLGPQASRAFGGRMRQLSYRYSGMEASPTQRREVTKKSAADLKISPESYENLLIEDLAKNGDIPNKEQHDASLKAGSTLPSKGFLLDKSGKVVSEAVGLSDDWYTPFNLKKLSKLNGGSYVRTRAYGGVTPEDLRTMMHTGAKRVTVVSNSGIYTVEMDKRAMHWGNRFGFGGAVMTRRYTKTLDAIQTGKAQVGDSRNWQGGGNRTGIDGTGYEAAQQDLKKKYPYYIQSVNRRALPKADFPTSKDTGYVTPLGIKASGASSGWFYKPNQTVENFDRTDEYRLHARPFLGIDSDSYGATTATTNTSSANENPYRYGGGSTNTNKNGVLPSRANVNEQNAQAAAKAGMGRSQPSAPRGPKVQLSDAEAQDIQNSLETANRKIARLSDRNPIFEEVMKDHDFYETLNAIDDNNEIFLKIKNDPGFRGGLLSFLNEVVSSTAGESPDFNTDTEFISLISNLEVVQNGTPAEGKTAIDRRESESEPEKKEPATEDQKEVFINQLLKNAFSDPDKKRRVAQATGQLHDDDQDLFDEYKMLVINDPNPAAAIRNTGSTNKRDAYRAFTSMVIDAIRDRPTVDSEQSRAPSAVTVRRVTPAEQLKTGSPTVLNDTEKGMYKSLASKGNHEKFIIEFLSRAKNLTSNVSPDERGSELYMKVQEMEVELREAGVDDEKLWENVNENATIVIDELAKQSKHHRSY